MQLQKVWDLTYDEYVQILLKKYGPATSNYVENGKVVASKAWDRGLECHHIDEDKFPNLSDIKEAERHPEYQTADRLVYCNRLEHLILHAKIAKMTHNDYNLRGLIGYFKGGCQLLITRLNDAYTNPPTEFEYIPQKEVTNMQLKMRNIIPIRPYINVIFLKDLLNLLLRFE